MIEPRSRKKGSKSSRARIKEISPWKGIWRSTSVSLCDRSRKWESQARYEFVHCFRPSGIAQFLRFALCQYEICALLALKMLAQKEKDLGSDGTVLVETRNKFISVMSFQNHFRILSGSFQDLAGPFISIQESSCLDIRRFECLQIVKTAKTFTTSSSWQTSRCFARSWTNPSAKLSDYTCNHVVFR